MPRKAKPIWETGKTEAGRFAGRLRQVAGKQGLDLDGIVRLSIRLKHPTVTRWWFGTRVPRPASIVDLARLLKTDPLKFIDGLDLDAAVVKEVEKIAAEGTA